MHSSVEKGEAGDPQKLGLYFAITANVGGNSDSMAKSGSPKMKMKMKKSKKKRYIVLASSREEKEAWLASIRMNLAIEAERKGQQQS